MITLLQFIYIKQSPEEKQTRHLHLLNLPVPGTLFQNVPSKEVSHLEKQICFFGCLKRHL